MTSPDFPKLPNPERRACGCMESAVSRGGFHFHRFMSREVRHVNTGTLKLCSNTLIKNRNFNCCMFMGLIAISEGGSLMEARGDILGRTALRKVGMRMQV